jgi:hypothetical protein
MNTRNGQARDTFAEGRRITMDEYDSHDSRPWEQRPIGIIILIILAALYAYLGL